MHAASDGQTPAAKPNQWTLSAPEWRLKFYGSDAIDSLVARHPGWMICALWIIGVAMFWPYRHFAGDDAYITFRFARNFATGHGFAFNPDVPVYGSTAPIWVFLIAAAHFTGLDYPDAAHALNWLFLAINIPLFFLLSRAYLGRTSAVLIATFLMIADPWFVRWSLSGMENGLALSLLMLLLLSQKTLRNSGTPNFLSPLVAALAGLCRPEMTLLSGFLILDNVLFEKRKKTWNIVLTLIICALIFTPWVWYAAAHFDSVIPTTIRAKISSEHTIAFVHVLEYFATFWPLEACAVVTTILLVLRDKLPVRFDHDSAAGWFLPVLWAVTLPAFYVTGGAPVAGRYMMFGLPCYLLIGVKAWTLLSSRLPRLVLTSIGATVLLVAFVQYKYCWYVTKWPQGMDPRMIGMAHTLAENSSPSSVVAGDQIGVLGYFSNRYVLDTYGLASPEILAYRKSGDVGPVWRYVHQRRPAFLFLGQTNDTLTRWDPAYGTLTLVDKEIIQREGSGGVGHLVTYYLYRTNW